MIAAKFAKLFFKTIESQMAFVVIQLFREKIKMSLKERAVSGVKWSGISSLGSFVLQFITLSVLARLLNPSDFGLMGMVMVVIGFAQAFADMGISNSIIHYGTITTDQLSSLYWLNLFSGLVIFCIICASTPLITCFYREPSLNSLLYLSSSIFLITPIGQQFQILLQKELRFDDLARVEIKTALVRSVVSIGLALAGFGVYSLILAQLTAACAKIILLFSLGWHQWRPAFHFAKKDLEGYVGFGFYQMGERSINYLNSNFDYLLIGTMLGAQVLGYYSLAYNLIIKPVVLINPIITKVAFPVFSLIQSETEKLQRGYLSVIQLLATVNFPVLFGLTILAPKAIPFIFGIKWTPSVVLIQILAVVGLLRSIGNPIGSLLLAKGRADLGFKWNLGLTVFQVPGLYLGAILGGAVGVALAYSILMFLYSVLSYPVLIRRLLGPCFMRYLKCIWSPLQASIIMSLAVILIGKTFINANQYVNLLIQIMSGLFIYICMIYVIDKLMAIEIMNLFLKRND